jgi:hypothetical protein
MKEQINLYYRLFDYDENILLLDTKLYLEKFENNKWVDYFIDSKEFKNIKSIDNINLRYKLNIDYALSEFGDLGIRGDKAFHIDTVNALINKRFGPSWDVFKQTIINGNFFLIITARGHEPKTIKDTIEFIIDYSLNDNEKKYMYENLAYYRKIYHKPEIDNKKLLKKYLNNCRYIGVCSEYFKKKYKKVLSKNILSTGQKKEIVIKEFIKYVHKYTELLHAKASINFSDDTIETTEHIEKIFKNELSFKYPYDFSISDTSNPEINGGITKKI